MKSEKQTLDSTDPLQVARNVAGLLLENDRVRVMRAILKPGSKAAMHSHPDHVVYVVKGGMTQFTSPSGKVDTMDLGTGKVVFMEAQTHEVTNVDKTEIEMIVIELK